MGAIKEEPFVADVAVELNDKKKEEKKKKKKKDNKKDDGRDPVVKDLGKEPISNTKKKTQEEKVVTKTPIDSPDAGIKLLEKEKKPKKVDEATETETQRVQRMENAANKKADEKALTKKGGDAAAPPPPAAAASKKGNDKKGGKVAPAEVAAVVAKE